MKRNNAGFTLWELMTVIAIIAIVSAMAVPNMIGWRERAKLTGAFENLRGDLQWAKIRAVRDHDNVLVLFGTDRYEINNAAGATIRARQMPAGVAITSSFTATFTSRGRCPDIGTIVLQDSAGEQRQISINPLGQIRQE